MPELRDENPNVVGECRKEPVFHLKANDGGPICQEAVDDALVPAQPVAPVLALPATLILMRKK